MRIILNFFICLMCVSVSEAYLKVQDNMLVWVAIDNMTGKDKDFTIVKLENDCYRDDSQIINISQNLQSGNYIIKTKDSIWEIKYEKTYCGGFEYPIFRKYLRTEKFKHIYPYKQYIYDRLPEREEPEIVNFKGGV